MNPLVHSRIVAAGPAQVFGACADPQSLARWWGPQGFTCAFEVFEFRVGGTWKFLMRAPDGTEFPNHNEFTEIVPGQKLVVRHVAEPHFTVTLRLGAEGRGTRVDFEQKFDDDAVAQAMESIVKSANEQLLDKLKVLVEGA